MWPRGLLCTFLAATAAATATDGETTFVERTPLDKIWCPIARAPGSLDVCGLVGKITPRFSSCACELAYVMATFLLAYYLYLEAEERGVDSSLQYEQLLQWISVFNQHYSREYALLEMPWPLVAGLRSLTSRKSAKGSGLSPRPAVDLVQAQKNVGRSFWAKYFCHDRCANQVSQTPSTPSTQRLVEDVAARVSRHANEPAGEAHMIHGSICTQGPTAK